MDLYPVFKAIYQVGPHSKNDICYKIIVKKYLDRIFHVLWSSLPHTCKNRLSKAIRNKLILPVPRATAGILSPEGKVKWVGRLEIFR